MKSTPDHYGSVAIALHWSIAALTLAALASGFAADAAGRDGFAMLRIHVLTGALSVLLTIARIVWWWGYDRMPDPAAVRPGLQATGAWLVHRLLVLVPLLMGASGFGMMVQSGGLDLLFGDAEGLLPQFETVRPRRPHGFGARLMVILTTVHVGAALYHHAVLRDGLIDRMWRPKGGG